MTGYVTLGGDKRGLTANGLSPVLFRKIFHQDFLQARVDNQKDNGAIMELYGKMAFIMQMQHDKSQAELLKLTESDYWEWLATINGADIENHFAEISAIYEGNEAPLSDPKDADA